MAALRGLRASCVFAGLVAWVASASVALGVVTLSGDTNVPDISTSAIGQQVQLSFSAAGMSPGQSLDLQLSIVDEKGGVVQTRTVPFTANASGNWSGAIAAPSSELGFYRVNAQLSNGTQLSAAGSRAAGTMTYAVMPDPAQRVNHGEQNSFFGMQGGFGPWRESAMRLMGARWELDGSFDWRRNEPNYAGQWNGQVTPAGPQAWTTYSLPTLFMAPSWAVDPTTFAYNTGALTAAGETAWANYATKAANAFKAKYPGREQNLYQVTWEPIQDWGYKGTDEQLLRIYEIAYNSIHAADPKAVVVGPTMGIQAEGGYPGNYTRETQSVTLLQKGLARYIDAFSVHPYYANAATAGSPEAEGMVDRVRYLKGIVNQYGAAQGKTLQMMGTEQGYQDDGTPAGELKAARYMMRENLIMMGEGFRFNFAFYAVDYSMDGGASIDRYGYYYNLGNGIPWGPGKVSPKPVAPAYAAQSLLLDGHQSQGEAAGLTGTQWGYRFDAIDGSDSLLALWDYGNSGSTYTLQSDAAQVLVYDWMGNATLMPTSGGQLMLTLTGEPIYVAVPEPMSYMLILFAAGVAILWRSPRHG